MAKQEEEINKINKLQVDYSPFLLRQFRSSSGLVPVSSYTSGMERKLIELVWPDNVFCTCFYTTITRRTKNLCPSLSRRTLRLLV